jgi:ADP-ribose pyrophosphatase YjhB (NUDIX family)
MQKKNRAAAIIVRNGKLLLFHRQKPGRDYYILPGGGVELEESFEEACIREVKEETGLDVLSLRLASRYITQEKEENYYLTRVNPGEPILGGNEAARNSPEDSYTFVWVDAAQLAGLNLLPGAARRICLEILRQPET